MTDYWVEPEGMVSFLDAADALALDLLPALSSFQNSFEALASALQDYDGPGKEDALAVMDTPVTDSEELASYLTRVKDAAHVLADSIGELRRRHRELINVTIPAKESELADGPAGLGPVRYGHQRLGSPGTAKAPDP
ncbi:hypothetical protein F7P69_06035 [Cellulosimicrobium funkei]|nr:hypothetical protein [Cellulosimicrobium funkei]